LALRLKQPSKITATNEGEVLDSQNGIAKISDIIIFTTKIIEVLVILAQGLLPLKITFHYSIMYSALFIIFIFITMLQRNQIIQL
jgi:hypothetical protein